MVLVHRLYNAPHHIIRSLSHTIHRPPLVTYLGNSTKTSPDGYTNTLGVSPTPRTRLGFDQVFLINLERRPDHLARMQQIADFIRLNMTVFPATDKNTFDRSTLAPLSMRMASSHLACWDSHMRVYRAIADNPAIETALILEDDIDFEFDLVAKWTQARAAVGSRPWDIFYLGHCGEGQGSPANAVSANAGLYHSSSPPCTHAYAVSKLGARMLLRLLAMPDLPFDLLIGDLIRKRILKSLAMHPPLITQVHLEGDQSDINGDGGFGISGEDVEISAEERLNMLKLLP
ncbi:hypothetical protein BJ085DRAFT_37704 [Dimargaris cristalligena]|uniref:Glycosyl transferase family 25 domain-containing protein n=1 Tax=Dimargaris cristalligena TaxID=215637 RepID=A0A4V1J426_9FUNG|nr:hypothetical protein BJ085DRAFT_37704 [Dimargaris cristalligena]|eukprot:RKP34089.1 hypothetical protein BJ085DRAFT_37704 [Dimargaris cristalligena]